MPWTTSPFLSHLANDERGGCRGILHMYTKAVECARFLAKTGVKINMSIAMTHEFRRDRL